MDFAELMASLSEEQRGLISGELSKKNSEAQNLRTRAKNLEALETRLKTELGVDALDDEVLTNLTGSLKTKQTSEQQLSILQKKLEAEAKARQEAEGKYGQLEGTVRAKDRDAQVRDSLGKIGVRGDAVGAASKLVAADATWDAEKGEWLFDGKTLDKYLTEFGKNHPYLLANPTAPGAGKPNGAPAGGNSGEFISKEQYMQMSQAEKAKNITLIRKSMAKWS